MINAVVYDLENVPNFFSYYAIDLNSDAEWYFEISDWRDDRAAFHAHLMWLAANDWYMIGFNNIGYDYNLIHAFFAEPVLFSAAKFYAITQSIIGSYDRFGTTVRPDDRFIKQIDVYKIHHFDNKAKTTSLKALQVNMRSESVMESSVPFGVPMHADQREEMATYNRHDTLETKKFALISMPMILFRLSMMAQINGDVLNFNDTKIGKELLAQRLGDVCYRYEGTKRVARQTPRASIVLRECIFPYIQFRHPEFVRVHSWLLQHTLHETKGAFEGVSANVNGFPFVFGTGGIHGSVERARFVADDEWAIVDDDVASLYPSIAIVNRLFPEHLGERFADEYKRLKDERFKFAKGTPENTALKLALNGTYGDSNNQYSVFYDPKFTMSITINGQLLLCMFAEWLLSVPTLSLIQINTDGVTYRVHRSMEWLVEQVRTEWQRFTLLDLETAHYSRMWVRDVNNYVAETTSGKLKLKGAYWTPDKHPDDIQNLSPTGWHRDYSADVCAKAAVRHMQTGQDIAALVRSHTDMFDFMCREKVTGATRVWIGDTMQGKVTRYYVARNGEPMRKIMASTHPSRVGQYKQARGVSDADYNAWYETHGHMHNPELMTKNKSTYEPERVTNLNAGMMVRECNHVNSFDWSNLNYDWYISESRKLVI